VAEYCETRSDAVYVAAFRRYWSTNWTAWHSTSVKSTTRMSSALSVSTLQGNGVSEWVRVTHWTRDDRYLSTGHELKWCNLLSVWMGFDTTGLNWIILITIHHRSGKPVDYCLSETVLVPPRKTLVWTEIGRLYYRQPHDWLIEHSFTSAPTQYKLYGRRFLRVWWRLMTQPTVSKH